MSAKRSKMTSPDGAADPPSPLPAEDRIAARLRGFGPLGILAILIILAGNFLVAPLSAILVLVWVRLSRTPWREIGYVRPKSWIRSIAIGIAFGVVFKLVMKAIVMPLLGAPPINGPYHYLAGNTAALPGMLLTLIIVAGFGEETVFRGWMFERLGKLFGSSVWARTFIVLLTSILFGLAHYTVQGSRRRRAGHYHRTGLRNDLRNQAPNFHADGGARRVRPNRARDHLLGSRIRGGSPHLQIAGRISSRERTQRLNRGLLGFPGWSNSLGRRLSHSASPTYGNAQGTAHSSPSVSSATPVAP